MSCLAVQKPKETISQLPKAGITKKQGIPLISKQEIISQLKDKIRFDIEKQQIFRKPKRDYIKHFSKDGDSLRKYGFNIKVPGEKKPEPTYVLPKSDTHTKRSIINHFKEVYKNG